MKWNPEDYAKSSDTQLKWAQELRQNLNLQGNESVLDVGCGDGKITADFATTLPKGRVTGVDSFMGIRIIHHGWRRQVLPLSVLNWCQRT